MTDTKIQNVRFFGFKEKKMIFSMGGDHNALMTAVFTQNYLHEIPTDIQFQIMKTVEDSIKQEKIDDLKKRLEKYTEGPTEDDNELFEATVGEDIVYMLRCAEDKEFRDEGDYGDWIFETINKICEDDFAEDNLDRMTKLVNHYGVIKALKLQYEHFGDENVLDVKEDEHLIYRRCYFMIVYDTYDNISLEDIQLMKELGISA